jgi:hypothetical protein
MVKPEYYANRFRPAQHDVRKVRLTRARASRLLPLLHYDLLTADILLFLAPPSLVFLHAMIA